MTITGQNFGSNAGTVTIGANILEVEFWSDIEVRGLTPEGVGLQLPLVLTTTQATSATALFSYDPPQIGSVAPSSGPPSGGTLVSIAGVSFGPFPGSVTLGGVVMVPEFWSHQLITASTPQGCGVGLSVAIQTPSGIDAATSFDYDPAYRVGDMTCNCDVNIDDIDLFVTALTDPDGFTGCDISRADINGDGAVKGDDIAGFVGLLL